MSNSSHWYGLMSSKLQNSSNYSPIEWYFNGVQTLPLLILHIAIALWVQNCKIPATIAHWNDISIRSQHWHVQFFTLILPYEFKIAKFQTLALLILHIAMALWVQNCKILATKASWNDVSKGQTLALLILHIAMALWVQNCKIPATIAQWNDISMGSQYWHVQFFTLIWPYEFKIAKFRPL